MWIERKRKETFESFKWLEGKIGQYTLLKMNSAYLDVGTALQEGGFTISKATIPQVLQFILHLLHFSLLVPAKIGENYSFKPLFSFFFSLLFSLFFAQIL